MQSDHGAQASGTTTSLRCAHGDVVVYPLAEVRVEVDGIVIDVRAAVSERLPASIILGTDAPTLQLLRSRPMVGEAFVLTRAQVRQQAEVEHKARHKEEESQTHPSPLDQGEGDDRVQLPGIDDMPLLCLDDDLFEIPRERSREDLPGEAPSSTPVWVDPSQGQEGSNGTAGGNPHHRLRGYEGDAGGGRPATVSTVCTGRVTPERTGGDTNMERGRRGADSDGPTLKLGASHRVSVAARHVRGGVSDTPGTDQPY